MKFRVVVLSGLTLGLSALAASWMPRSDVPAHADAAQRERESAQESGGRATVFPSHRPSGFAPSVAAGVTDQAGNPVSISCATCHATRPPARDQGLGGSVPTTFHQGLKYAHANLSCLSCHHQDDYDMLRLADGRSVPFAEAQQLCAQCHGPQTRDYLAGSHGGMTGYWDKTKGPRVRNTCTDCHDPHAPAYPMLTPVFAPIDGAAKQQAEREARHPVQHDTTPFP